ncbi:Type 1 glutamine amidotransferase-like domain-containing protein [Gephyromycinifex aptenodytis]|uniref:Type 1 glutamine amidotransferase-like domain-containing protein n=1 Tax=Gephyromycinifex aptenodytis TaxID=2716227 RepID=UPI001445BB2C|nr:peptidase E [Gephyromycinifex aptenodytis]
MSTHLVAMGGGGFSSSEGYAATSLDRYILSLTDATNPLVCFVPTASADDGIYVSRFINAYSPLGVRTCVLTLWSGAADAIARMEEVDVFVVGGGNTLNMLALWNAHGVSRRFRDLAADSSHDLVLAGVSAGGAIWHEGCTTDSFGSGVAALNHGLGVVPGSFCPHYDSEPERAPQFKEFIDTTQLPSGWGVDDGAALHYVDGKFADCVTEKEGASVYRVEQDENGATIAEQDTRLL